MGLLDLRRISWQHSSGDLLQKIMQCRRRLLSFAPAKSLHAPCKAGHAIADLANANGGGPRRCPAAFMLTWDEYPMRCRYEAVEPMSGWEDLRQRLYPNRRVHACFHPTMPAEPLVILHAALRDRVASTVAEILDENRQGADANRPQACA